MARFIFILTNDELTFVQLPAQRRVARMKGQRPKTRVRA
jgi:hypothetical protein